MDKEQQIDYQAREIARYCLDSPDSNFRKSVFIGKERRSIPGEIMNFVDRDKARLCGLALNERYNFNIKGLNLKDIVLSLICIHENVEELGYLDRIYAEATAYFLKARTLGEPMNLAMEDLGETAAVVIGVYRYIRAKRRDMAREEIDSILGTLGTPDKRNYNEQLAETPLEELRDMAREETGLR